MGVPALFRWLSRKYPKIVTEVKEDEEPEHGQNLDIRNANPNGQEFDNLYLDFNGIVHNCTHPEGQPAPETEEAMMVEIFKYTERLVQAIRPRKLLMIAVDGVAPRAKMNQQRGRRFRTAMDAAMKEEERLAAVEEWRSMGRDVSESMESKRAWDSNAITPGTPFMDLLAASIRYWVAHKINVDPGWADLKVIVSDASVPGEGEHKIMDLIRRQRLQPGYDPNTSHVVHGLDADLIMLSLAAHEPNFKVLREDVFADERKRRGGGGCHRCGIPGHHSSMCTAPPKEEERKKPTERKALIFLDVSILREYLEVELNIPGQPFKFDLERAIDDWIFMIFFVGNDFLPHLPSLDIREGAIDTLLKIWRAGLAQMGGYLTEHGTLHLDRAQVMLDGLAIQEDDIFRRRREAEERQGHGEKRRRVEKQRSMPSFADSGMQDTPQDFVQVRTLSASVPNSSGFEDRLSGLPAKPNSVMSLDPKPVSTLDREKIAQDNRSAASRLRAEIMGGKSGSETQSEQPRGTKRSAEEAGMPQGRGDVDEEEVRALDRASVREADDRSQQEGEQADEGATQEEEADGMAPVLGTKPPPLKLTGNVAEQEDMVKLWEPGYKERYYRQKFGVELGDADFRQSIVKSYVEGLCWVLAYYYQGCPSWSWYYPYHFSPFAADFTNLASLNIEFDLSTPVQPIEQLMSVFPAASKTHIPEVLHDLMTEPTSEIIDFYPERFHIDMNGKKMIWQGVALLPFIDRPRLIAAITPRLTQLTSSEVQRNTRGENVLFVGERNATYADALSLYANKEDKATQLDFKASHGLSGTIAKSRECIPNSTFESPLTDVGLQDITNDQSLSVIFRFPEIKTPHRSVLLNGRKPQQRMLSDRDLERTRNAGAPEYERSGNDGFHNTRRDIDGTGNSRARDYEHRRPYPPQNGRGYNDRYDSTMQSRRQPESHYGSSATDYRGRTSDPYGGYGAPHNQTYNGYGGQHTRYDQHGAASRQQGHYDSPYTQSAPQYQGYTQGHRPSSDHQRGYPPYQPPVDTYRPGPPPPARMDNRDFTRQLPAHLLSAAGLRSSYKR